MNESVMISLLGERLAEHGAIFQLASTMHHKYIDFVTSNLNGTKNRVEDLVDTWCQVGTVFEGELLTVKTENQILLKQLDEQQTLLKELKNTKLLLAQRSNHSSPNNDLNSDEQEDSNNHVHSSSRSNNQKTEFVEKMMMLTDESSTSDNVTKCIEKNSRMSPNGGIKSIQLSDGIGDSGLSDGILLTKDMHKLLAENLEIKLNDINLPMSLNLPKIDLTSRTNNSVNNNNSINNNNTTNNTNNTTNNNTSNNIAISSNLLIDSSENEEDRTRNTSADEFKLLNELLGSVTKNNGLSSNSTVSLPMLFHNNKVLDFENNNNANISNNGGHSSNLDHENNNNNQPTSNNLSSNNINTNKQLNNTTPNNLTSPTTKKHNHHPSSSSNLNPTYYPSGMKRPRTNTTTTPYHHHNLTSSNLTVPLDQQLMTEARCDICMKQFAHRHSMIRHKKMIHLLTCPQPDCNRSFGTREELDRHEKTDHSKQCPFCGKQILKRLGLKTHLETCTKNPMKNRSQEISWALG